MVGSLQSDRTGPGIKLRRWFSAKEKKDRREMVIVDVHVINKKRMLATPAHFATKHCAWSMLERGRTENTHLPKAWSHNESGSFSDPPIKSSCTGLVRQHFTR